MNMKPSWETVEYASTFLMSYCTKPMVAANIAVAAPVTAMVVIATGESAKRKLRRATMYTPAVTMVAAWMSADTGVGPAMASGSQTYRGICADFAVAPTKSNRHAAVATFVMASACTMLMSRSMGMSSVALPSPLAATNRMNIPSRNAKSPTRFTMNAFLPAAALAMSWYQNPIKRYEHRPTPSQPTNRSG